MTGKEIVNFKGLKALGVPYCRVHIFRLEKSGEFPRHFKLRPHHNSPPVWWLAEVLEWITSKSDQPQAS